MLTNTKWLPPGKRNARMYNIFISQEKDKEQELKCKENLFLKTYFCIFYLLSVVISREHVGTQSTLGT